MRFTWDDASMGGPMTEDVPVTVGDVGQEVPAVLHTTDSGCLDLTGVPEPEWTIESWSAIRRATASYSLLPASCPSATRCG